MSSASSSRAAIRRSTRSIRIAAVRAWREDQGGPTLEVLGVASVGRQRFTPQPRLSDRFQVLDTISYFAGSHQLKAGFDFNYIDNPNGRLPLHFGGRYIFAALPAIPGLLPVPVSRHSGGGARVARALRPGLRPVAQRRTSTRTSPSLPRTTGA